MWHWQRIDSLPLNVTIGLIFEIRVVLYQKPFSNWFPAYCNRHFCRTVKQFRQQQSSYQHLSIHCSGSYSSVWSENLGKSLILPLHNSPLKLRSTSNTQLRMPYLRICICLFTLIVCFVLFRVVITKFIFGNIGVRAYKIWFTNIATSNYLSELGKCWTLAAEY